jgi:hypothetical protein
MSLSDRYNRGGGRIQNFDRYLTELGDRLGNYWLDRTGFPRAALTQGLYLTSAWAASYHFSLFRNPIMAIFLGGAILSLLGAAQSKGGIVEQIQSEAAGLPRNTLAFMRLLTLGLGVFNLAMATAESTALIVASNPPPTTVKHFALLGLTLSALQAGEYIRRTNPATPGNASC